MNKLSRLGLILGSLYALFVILCLVGTEYCFRNDGLICATGYYLPGFPWSLLVGAIPDNAFDWLGPKLSNAVFWAFPAVSTIVNLYLSYWYGRVIEESRRPKVHQVSNYVE